MATNLPERAALHDSDKWDTVTIFPSVDAWEEAIAAAPAQVEALLRFRGKLADDPETLLNWLQAREKVQRLVTRLFVYANLEYSVDMRDQAATARVDRARSLYGHTSAMTAFAEPEILLIESQRLEQWMETEPRLRIYDHYFDRLRQRAAHVRTPDIEEILNDLSDPFGAATTTHRILVDAELAFEPAERSGEGGASVEIAQSNFNALITDADRSLRRTAWEHYADSYLMYKNTLANCLAVGVKQHAFTARSRYYASSLEAALAPNHIPVEVYYNTIETVQRHLPIWHRYWRVRREILGYDALHVYDLKAPLTAAKPEIPFEQAVDWICEGMAPLGERYVATMRRGILEERWVDRYPNQGKRSGAFSSGMPETHPFIFMSYVDDMFSLSTLAHELGHSMHSYLAWQTQPYVYSRYSLFVAEVASNFNQALVRAYLLEKEKNPAFLIAVLEEAFSNFHRYFFIMPMLSRFELEVHQRAERREALPADELTALMAGYFAEGYGDEVVIDHDRIGITWAQFPNHIYANFYVFQYTTGIAAAHALARRVLSGDEEAVDSYLAFLRAGGSLYPLEALQLAGVDMTSSAPVAEAFAVLEAYVDRLERLTARKSD
jgi:oligoendopeptidase F